MIALLVCIAVAGGMVASRPARAAGAQADWTLTYAIDWHSTGATGSGGVTMTFPARRGGTVAAQGAWHYDGVYRGLSEEGDCPVSEVGTARLTGTVSRDFVIDGIVWVDKTITLGGPCAYEYTITVPVTVAAVPLQDGAALKEAISPDEDQSWTMSGHERWRMTMDVNEVLWGRPAPRLPRGHLAGVMLRSRLTIDFERSGQAFRNAQARLDGFRRRRAFSRPAGRYAVRVLPGNWATRRFPVAVAGLTGRILRFTVPHQSLTVRWWLLRAASRRVLRPRRWDAVRTPDTITAEAKEYTTEFVVSQPGLVFYDVDALAGGTDQPLDDAIWLTKRSAVHFSVEMLRLS